MAVDKFTGVVNFAEHAQNRRRPSPPGSGSGDGDDLEPRVKALEENFAKVDRKLDSIAADIGGLKVQIAGMDGRATSLATSADLRELKGSISGLASNERVAKIETRIEKLPTTARLVAILGLCSTVLIIALNSQKIWEIVGPLLIHK